MPPLVGEDEWPEPGLRLFEIEDVPSTLRPVDRNRILSGLSPVSDLVGLAQRGGRRPAGSRWSCQRAKASTEGRL